jgi:hypothetical protein
MDHIINLCPIKTHIHAPLPLQSGITPHHLQVDAVQTCLNDCFMFIVLCILIIYIHTHKSPRCNNAQYIFLTSLQVYPICFGCHLHPSSGIQKTVRVDHWYKSYCEIQS